MLLHLRNGKFPRAFEACLTAIALKLQSAKARVPQAAALALGLSCAAFGAAGQSPSEPAGPASSGEPWRPVHPMGGLVSGARIVTLGGPSGPNNSGIWSNLILEGVATSATDLLVSGGYVAPQNYIGCADQVTAGPISGFPNNVPCLVINDMIGAYAIGSRTGLWVDEQIVGDTSAEVGNDFYSAIESVITASSNVGGGPGSPLGNIYGIGTEVTATGAASYYGTITGGEFDVSAQAGSAPFRKTGVQIVAFNDDSDHGSVVDAGIEIAASRIASGGGFGTGILIGGSDEWPIRSGGTIMGDGGNRGTAAIGIDLHDVSFTSAAFYADGLVIASGLSNYSSTGNFNIDQGGGNGTMVGFASPGTAIADHVQITGAAAGGAPMISIVGSDANSGLVLQGKGNLGVQIAGAGGFVVGNPPGGYEGAGNVNAAGYFASGAGGANCGGSPSQSFAVRGGIVIRC